MLCEECGKRPATVHLTSLHNEMDRHLCSQCAKSYGDYMPGMSLANLLSGMIDMPDMWTTVREASPTRCPLCQLSLQEISKRGQLGCSECYATFSRQLEPFLRRIHGTTHHVGKSPLTGSGRTSMQQRLEALRQSLQQAVQSENYEQAAGLRDEIRDLEKQLAQGQGGEVDEFQ